MLMSFGRGERKQYTFFHPGSSEKRNSAKGKSALSTSKGKLYMYVILNYEIILKVIWELVVLVGLSTKMISVESSSSRHLV